MRRFVKHEAAREGAWLHVLSDSGRASVAALIAEGDRKQLADKRFRCELAAWMRPNRSRTRRGMRGIGFGFGDLMSLASPVILRAFDLGWGQAARDRKLAEHSPLLAVLGTDGDSTRERLQAGQAMERVLLRACTLGLTASFLNQPVEVKTLRSRLADATAGSGSAPQLVMRLGYGPEIAPAPRESVVDVLIRRQA